MTALGSRTSGALLFALLHRSASLCVLDRVSGTIPGVNREKDGYDDFHGTRGSCRAAASGVCRLFCADIGEDFELGRLHWRRGADDTYRNDGNHAEAIEISFDPKIVQPPASRWSSFSRSTIPGTVDRQGYDRRASYRSAIFYTSDEQKRIAEDTIADVDATGPWPGYVVTEVAPAGPFWDAEAEHQDYLERFPDGYTCHLIRPDWKLPHRAEKAATGASGVSAA